MPAPPDESEPAMVSAIGVVIILLAGVSAIRKKGRYPLVARPAIGSKFACHGARFFALLAPTRRLRR
jgi:hypothetical protein